MTAQNMPPAEVNVDAGLLRDLLADQHADLAGLPIDVVANGWDNVIFRVGDQLTARLPRRKLAAELVRHEQRWLPELAPRLPLPVPVPLRVGTPGQGYPWHWSICRWLPGRPAITTALDDEEAAAQALGGFVAALHQPAPPDAPVNPYRGVALSERSATLVDRVQQLGTTINGSAVLSLWDEFLATPPWTGPPLWLHGDLHPGNLLVYGGALSAVIDFGDLTAGDPATDLAVAWMLLSPPARPAFRAAIGAVDDHTWRRGRAWALALALALLANSADNPTFARLGHRTLDAVLSDPG